MDEKSQKINDTLVRVYEALKFTSEEVKGALNDLVGIQQIAVATELLKSLTESEVKTLNDLASKSDEEKKKTMEQIAQAHKDDKDFAGRARAAAKKVLDDHIAYLKTRGDEGQKEEIGKILAAIA
jgi:hypothetical protein